MVPSWEAVSQLDLTAYISLIGVASGVVGPLVNSLIVASATATLAMLLTLLAAWVIVRTTIRWRWFLDQLIAFALVFPGVVAAIAVMRTYLALPLPIYGTIWLLVAGYLLRYIPYAMRYSHAGLLRIHSELEESCWVAGASLFRSFRTVVVPLMMPALFAGWIFVFLTTVRELEVALLLSSPSSRMISSALYERWESGALRDLASFAIVVTIFFVGLAAIMSRISSRYGIQTSNR